MKHVWTILYFVRSLLSKVHCRKVVLVRAEGPCNDCDVTVYLRNQTEMLHGATQVNPGYNWLIVLSYVIWWRVPPVYTFRVTRIKGLRWSIYVHRLLKNLRQAIKTQLPRRLHFVVYFVQILVS